MINREDMLELTRRMTPSRTSFTRVAGGYMEPDGEIDESFNVNFLNLSAVEKEKNLAIAKAVPFAATNVNLRSYAFGDGAEQRKMRQLLYGMYTFYELVGARYCSREPYAILIFHDRYDVPVKASDKERQGESEEVYEYLIGAVAPLVGEYEPGRPACGFLYPAFADRSTDDAHVALFQADPEHKIPVFEELFLTR